jgi:hypothetical protein
MGEVPDFRNASKEKISGKYQAQLIEQRATS